MVLPLVLVLALVVVLFLVLFLVLVLPGTSIDKCKGSSPIKAEPNHSTSIYSWKDRHA